MAKRRQDDELSDREIAERMERALRRSFELPHRPHHGAPKTGKTKARPASKGRVRKGRSRS